jgi:tetratricopeptide (TPR) repeat protein
VRSAARSLRDAVARLERGNAQQRAKAVSRVVNLLSDPSLELADGDRMNAARSLGVAEIPDPVLAFTLNLCGLQFAYADELEQSVDYFERGVAALPMNGMDSPSLEGELHHNLASSLHLGGDSGRAIPHWLVALEAFKRADSVENAVESAYFLIEVAAEAGEVADAQELMEGTRDWLSRRSHAREAVLLVCRCVPLIEVGAGKTLALKHLRSALRQARRARDPWLEAAPLMALASLELEEDGSSGHALRWARKAARCADASEDATLRVAAHRLLARVEANRGNLAGGMQRLASVALLPQADPSELAVARVEGASLKSLIDADDAALAALRSAVEHYESLVGEAESGWARRNLVRAEIARLEEPHQVVEFAVADPKLDGEPLAERIAGAVTRLVHDRAWPDLDELIGHAMLRLDPSELAEMASALGRWELHRNAVTVWDAALVGELVDPIVARYLRAHSLAEVGRESEAVEEFRHCMLLVDPVEDTNFALAVTANLGELLRRIDRPHEALEILDRAEELAAPGDEGLLLLRGLALIDADRSEEAYSLFHTLVASARTAGRDDLLATSLAGLGTACAETAPDEAEDAYRQSLELRQAARDRRMFESAYNLLLLLDARDAELEEQASVILDMIAALDDQPPEVAVNWTVEVISLLSSSPLLAASAAAYGTARALQTITSDRQLFIDAGAAAVNLLRLEPIARDEFAQQLSALLPDLVDELLELFDKVAAGMD